MYKLFGWINKDITFLLNTASIDFFKNRELNSAMKQFRATVRASGLIVTTIVFAENTNLAMKILQAQFGANNVISIPTQIGSCR